MSPERFLARKCTSIPSQPSPPRRRKDSVGLRPYQLSAIEETRAKLRQGKRSIVIALPTGAGKTRTACASSSRRIPESEIENESGPCPELGQASESESEDEGEVL